MDSEAVVLSAVKEHGPSTMKEVVGFVSPVNFNVEETVRRLLNRGELHVGLDWKIRIPEPKE